MHCNMGKADQIARLILGLVIIGIGIYFQSWWGAVGLILVATAAIRRCPLYMPFKISTCKTEQQKS